MTFKYGKAVDWLSYGHSFL